MKKAQTNVVSVSKEKIESQHHKANVKVLSKVETELDSKWNRAKSELKSLAAHDFKTKIFNEKLDRLIYRSRMADQVFIVDRSSGARYFKFHSKPFHSNFWMHNHQEIKDKLESRTETTPSIIQYKDQAFIWMGLPYQDGFIVSLVNLEYFKKTLEKFDDTDISLGLLDSKGSILNSDVSGLRPEISVDESRLLQNAISSNLLNLKEEDNALTLSTFQDEFKLSLFKSGVKEELGLAETEMELVEVFEVTQDANLINLIYVLSGLILLMSILGFLVAKSNTDPILHLRRAINEIIEGNYKTRLSFRANNELDDVADSFNMMITKLDASREDLIEQNSTIEKQALALMESNNMLENYAFIVSHDLKEPIRTVQSFSHILLKKNNDVFDDESKEYATFIQKGCQRMSSIIDDLLEFSRLNDNKIHKEFETHNLNNILDIVKSNLLTKLKETGTKLYIEELPEAKVIPSYILSLFQNLITNAIKYNESETPEIHIFSTETDQHFTIFVKDNGIGINEEDKGIIFNLFSRLKRSAKNTEGNGIGLATCKKIVKKHNGIIDVISNTASNGSTFFFTIPKSTARKESKVAGKISELS